MRAGLSVVASVRLWIANGAPGELPYAVDLDGYTKAFSRVSMLAKPTLFERLGKVHRLLQEFIAEPAPEPAAVERLADDAIKELSAFEDAAKEELGIGPMLDHERATG